MDTEVQLPLFEEEAELVENVLSDAESASTAGRSERVKKGKGKGIVTVRVRVGKLIWGGKGERLSVWWGDRCMITEPGEFVCLSVVSNKTRLLTPIVLSFRVSLETDKIIEKSVTLSHYHPTPKTGFLNITSAARLPTDFSFTKVTTRPTSPSLPPSRVASPDPCSEGSTSLPKSLVSKKYRHDPCTHHDAFCHVNCRIL
eukprot:TRINITY_DN27573_c0_g1_i1.p1 TRINITY_DN27573_c0_g1~~TRINITY_DN27573_c0_g1_i1.p1  ORF type:complete len:213 (+),score=26.22 TRINITY_DN27573_c0_g1_i1:40-639(+)